MGVRYCDITDVCAAQGHVGNMAAFPSLQSITLQLTLAWKGFCSFAYLSMYFSVI